MAEGLLRQMLLDRRIEGVEVRSAGTMTGGGSPASEGSQAACREVDVDLSRHRSTPLTHELVSWPDLILCMENYHATTVTDWAPSASAKTHLLGEFGSADDPLEIPDPVGLPLSHYRKCRDHISECLRGLLNQLPDIQNRWDTLFLGSDETGRDLKVAIVKHLVGLGRKVQDCCPSGVESMDDLGAVVDVGRRVGGHLAKWGILVGISGIGMSIAANKIPGVRAALCPDVQHAVLSRELHNANVLCLGARTVDEEKAIAIVDAWLSTRYLGKEDDARVAVFEKLEYEFSGR
jgi:RpiB/LacA/LacB family sugar-phosphate isomerase